MRYLSHLVASLFLACSFASHAYAQDLGITTAKSQAGTVYWISPDPVQHDDVALYKITILETAMVLMPAEESSDLPVPQIVRQLSCYTSSEVQPREPVAYLEFKTADKDDCVAEPMSRAAYEEYLREEYEIALSKQN